MIVKSQLIERLAKKQPFISLEEVHNLVNLVLETTTDTLRQGGRIEMRGFGAFSIRYHQARQARNPKTGEQLVTEPYDGVHFKPGKLLRERIAQARTQVEIQSPLSTTDIDGENA